MRFVYGLIFSNSDKGILFIKNNNNYYDFIKFEIKMHENNYCFYSHVWFNYLIIRA